MFGSYINERRCVLKLEGACVRLERGYWASWSLSSFPRNLNGGSGVTWRSVTCNLEVYWETWMSLLCNLGEAVVLREGAYCEIWKEILSNLKLIELAEELEWMKLWNLKELNVQLGRFTVQLEEVYCAPWRSMLCNWKEHAVALEGALEGACSVFEGAHCATGREILGNL